MEVFFIITDGNTQDRPGLSRERSSRLAIPHADHLWFSIHDTKMRGTSGPMHDDGFGVSSRSGLGAANAMTGAATGFRGKNDRFHKIRHP
ncbi:MAG: hypothetical protein H7829_02200 [Magnetococcus sp. THC-1_WYH]